MIFPQPALLDAPVMLLTEFVGRMQVIPRYGSRHTEVRSTSGQLRWPSSELSRLGVTGFADAVVVSGTPYAAPWLLEVMDKMTATAASTGAANTASAATSSLRKQLLVVSCLLSKDKNHQLACVNSTDVPRAGSVATRKVTIFRPPPGRARQRSQSANLK